MEKNYSRERNVQKVNKTASYNGLYKGNKIRYLNKNYSSEFSASNSNGTEEFFWRFSSPLIADKKNITTTQEKRKQMCSVYKQYNFLVRANLISQS